MNSSPSQARLILRRLRMARGSWVPLAALWRASGSMAVHSRIAELRRHGHAIENQTTNSGRRRRSAYRLKGGE